MPSDLPRPKNFQSGSQQAWGCYARFGPFLWALVFVAALWVAQSSEEFSGYLTTFGTLLVALLAIWKEGISMIFNLAGARLDFRGKDPQTHNIHGRESYQFHGELTSLNFTKPLENVRVVFSSYSVDGKLVTYAVARQFCWAPHESESRSVCIRTRKVFDLFYLDVATGELRVIIYGNEGCRLQGEACAVSVGSGKEYAFHIQVESENLFYESLCELRVTIGLDEHGKYNLTLK